MKFKSLVFALLVSSATALANTDKWFAAAIKGDLDAMLSLYSDNPDLLNTVDGDTGRTALVAAVTNGHTKLAESLLGLPDIDARACELGGGKNSAMDVACSQGNFEVFEMLIGRVDINEENEMTGLRAIHEVCRGDKPGHYEILRSLLENNHGVTTLDQSRENMNCLEYVLRPMRASQFRQPLKLTAEAYEFKRDLVRLILQHGASTADISDDEVALLGLSFKEIRAARSRESQEEFVALARSHIKKKKTNLKTHRPKEQSLPVMRGAKWKSANARMLEAIQRGNLKWLVKEVKDHGADVNVVNPHNKQTPFMTSSLKGEMKMMETLLELGADPTKGEENGYTAFHGAGFQGHAAVARFLCDKVKQLDPNDMHKDGYRPIHRACWGKMNRHAEFVKALIEDCGVDPDSLTKRNETPLQVLVSNDQYFNHYTARVLAEGGATVSKLKEEHVLKLRLVSDDDFSTCPARFN